MTQVHISGQDHTVTVNHDGADLAYVLEKAQKLWEDTRPASPPAPGPAYGFATERRWSRHTDAPGLHTEA